MFSKLDKFIGGVKNAVVLILVFTVCMIYGTFQESLHGTEYASKLIYKSNFFIIIQFLLFLCIAMAALLRMPPKKRLYGFYTIHLGLIIIVMGSFVTFYAGIDGHITLTRNNETSSVILNEDILKISFPDRGRSIIYPLPDSVTPINLNQTFEDIHLMTYLPFADEKVLWSDPKIYKNLNKNIYHSSEYLLANNFVSQNLILSIHPEVKGFDSTTQLGPLGVHYLPQAMESCFKAKNPSGLFFWGQASGECFTLEQSKAKTSQTKEGKKFIVLKHNGKYLTFFYELSPWPYENFENADPKINKNSNIKLFNKNLFKTRPHLFLFGKSAAYYEQDKWQLNSIDSKTQLDLPWMGFSISLIKHEYVKIPTKIPHYVVPRQEKSEIVSGKLKALNLSISGQNYWIKSFDPPLTLLLDGKKAVIELTKKSLNLPFKLTLDRFKMKTDPGTNNPASYESFIKLFDKSGTKHHHVFMNNPLKYLKFTFYQSSYFKDDQNDYGSVLSVNYDPGRFWKYFGSLLLVFGAMWHYYIRKYRVKRPSTSSST